MNDFSDTRVPVIHFVRDLFLCRIICCLPPHDRVPTDLASQGIEEVGEKSRNFVDGCIGWGKITFLIRSCDYCCDIVPGQKHNELFWLISIGFLSFNL